MSVQRLSHPDDPARLMKTVEITAGLPGWQGWLVSKSQFRNHTYNGPLHGTERGELIVAPNFLLYGSLGLLGTIPLRRIAADWRAGGTARLRRRRRNLFGRLPLAQASRESAVLSIQPGAPMLGVFWFVILAGLGQNIHVRGLSL